MPEHQWQQFFDAHAPRYEENEFTHNTVAEIDFFLNLFPIPKGAAILDVGCGTGRHSIELAKRGYKPVGIDISAGMLAQAKENAGELAIEWIQADAATFSLDRTFDAAICLCEGAFNLISEGDDPEVHDRQILQNVSRHLKPAAPFLLTAMNGYQTIRQMTDEHVEGGAFDPVTMVAHYQDTWTLPEGPKVMEIRERLFIPPEIVRMLRESGFRVDHVYGGTAGAWAPRPIRLDEIEVMFVCRKA